MALEVQGVLSVRHGDGAILLRRPTEERAIKALREHGHCEACNIDYTLDFARSVEAVFRVHPSIREAELGVYCIGGPAHSLEGSKQFT